MLKRIFLEHPRTVGESYLEHQRSAFGFGGSLLVAGLICLAHGLVPAWFETTASRKVAALHVAMTAKRRRVPAGQDPADNVIAYSI